MVLQFLRLIYIQIDDIVNENSNIDSYFEEASNYFSNLIEKDSNFKIDSTEVEGHFILVTAKRSLSIKKNNIDTKYSNIKYSAMVLDVKLLGLN